MKVVLSILAFSSFFSLVFNTYQAGGKYEKRRLHPELSYSECTELDVDTIAEYVSYIAYPGAALGCFLATPVKE